MIYNMEIWTHFNSGVLRVPFSRWIPSSISVCSGENGRGSTLWLPLYFAHIYCNYIFLKFPLVALLLNNFFSWPCCWRIVCADWRRSAVSIKRAEKRQSDHCREKAWWSRRSWCQAWRWRGSELGALKTAWGNTDNYTGAKFKIYTSLIVRSYHLENPLCITTWKMWK